MSTPAILTVPIENPDGLNLVLGQAHFIKTVEDLYEALAGSSPHLRFGLAFSESSGPRLVRSDGNDPELVALGAPRAPASARLQALSGFPAGRLRGAPDAGRPPASDSRATSCAWPSSSRGPA